MVPRARARQVSRRHAGRDVPEHLDVVEPRLGEELGQLREAPEAPVVLERPAHRTAARELEVDRAADPMRDGIEPLLLPYVGHAAAEPPALDELLLRVPPAERVEHHRSAGRERPGARRGGTPGARRASGTRHS